MGRGSGSKRTQRRRKRPALPPPAPAPPPWRRAPNATDGQEWRDFVVLVATIGSATLSVAQPAYGPAWRIVLLLITFFSAVFLIVTFRGFKGHRPNRLGRGISIVLVALFVIYGIRGVVLSVSDARVADVVLTCAPDTRLELTKTSAGNLPMNMIYLSEYKYQQVTQVSNDAVGTSAIDGATMQVSPSGRYLRCSLVNDGEVDLTDLSLDLTVRFGFALPYGDNLGQPIVASIKISELQPRIPYLFGVVNFTTGNDPVFVVDQQIKWRSAFDRTVAPHQLTIARDENIQTRWQIEPQPTRQQEKFRHFSKCHFEINLTVAVGPTPLPGQTLASGVLPPECSPEALRREKEQWEREDRPPNHQ